MREEGPMKLGVFISDYSSTVDTIERLKSDKLGIFLVQNGVYHAAILDKGKGSSVLDAAPRVYVLREDLETRGFAADAVDSRAKVVGYGDIVDLVFNEYPKIAWL
jgi:sulfur relay protein TusB/DsrH